MFLKQCVQLLLLCALISAEKCDHRPAMAEEGSEPQRNPCFKMTVKNKGVDANEIFSPDQRYAITLSTTNRNRTFRWFMITLEDPDVDDSNYEFRGQAPDIGNLKTIDGDRSTKYHEACLNTVENMDNAEKESVSVHWLSPKGSPKAAAKVVRIRAMVAENAEMWYVSPDLSVTLHKTNESSIDTPINEAVAFCGLCSEARYEVIFKGQWSRLTHPLQFPINVDKNAYSFMVGASHGFEYTLWEPGVSASTGLKIAAETADMSALEQEIISFMGTTANSTRTLLRGQRNAHPNMFNPSHSLFRVDRIHHLFSVVIVIKPSPDWFLGAHKFELCTRNGWVENETLPLFPWDAGTMDGVSYTSPTKMTSPPDVVGRVALGSFDRESPFYQINLNDLKPFGHLQVNLLGVYPVKGCENIDTKEPENLITSHENDETKEPEMAESRMGCSFSEWGPWSPCAPDDSTCGSGTQFRIRYKMHRNSHYKSRMNENSNGGEMCVIDDRKSDTEYQECYVDCY